MWRAAMHGLIHLQLEDFAVSEFGRDAWEGVVADAGLQGKVYSPDERYDDDELLHLVLAAASASGRGPQLLLEDFGVALVPGLLANYGRLVDPNWRTLELIENTEAMIHTALRADDPAARPPLLRCTRRGSGELLLIYASERQMCGLAKGIARGVAAHFGDELIVTDEACMLTGAGTCNISLRLATAT